MTSGVLTNLATLLHKEASRDAYNSGSEDVPAPGTMPGRGGSGKTPRDNVRLRAEVWITYIALVATFLVTSLVL
jgi:hypothetical protein